MNKLFRRRKNRKEKIEQAVNKMLESEKQVITYGDLDRALVSYYDFKIAHAAPDYLIIPPEQKKVIENIMEQFNHE